MNILLTGFGPFPGAPINPTGRLVKKLARGRSPVGVRRTAHVFRTSYDTIDYDFPRLLMRDKPDVLLMFGLAARTRHLRIETRARNARSLAIPDAAGKLPDAGTIAPEGTATLAMRTPSQRLLKAARAAGVDAQLSRDAGNYLCNYLCWRATEATTRPGGPQFAAFIHVPQVGVPDALLTFDDLVRAGEAIVQAAIAAARSKR
jgi:pyroglutamyl-peptidase